MGETYIRKTQDCDRGDKALSYAPHKRP